MKILVFSDSHGKGKNISSAIELHKKSCDLVVFLGDGLSDIDYLKSLYPELTFFAVKGNCDFFTGGTSNLESVFDLDGIKVLITHGHRYGVKSGVGTILKRAHELDADAVFFGHTHTPYDDILDIGEKRIHLFNPGSIGYGGTYGVVNTSGRVLVTSHTKIQ
ncbi:MAG: YfcE family phosphodiesterase [Clostridia bacterium]|nr:YfcE family phosphodiesterase [Clostridia bacterium]